jgi:dienelactone hydrolase
MAIASAFAHAPRRRSIDCSVMRRFRSIDSGWPRLASASAVPPRSSWVVGALDAIVSFHGALNTNLPAQPGAVKASVLVLNGADDTYVSAEHIAAFQAEMSAAGADWQFVNLAGAVHCGPAPALSSPGRVESRGLR